MITINFERIKLEEIYISRIAFKVMPAEVLAKVNDIITKLTNNNCHIDKLDFTTSVGFMEDPYHAVIQHTNENIIVKIYENRLVTI